MTCSEIDDPHDGPRRFYFADGRTTSRGVAYDDSGRPRMFWALLDYPHGHLALSISAPAPTARKRTFRRRDYAYAPDFVGPHRDSDYAEDS